MATITIRKQQWAPYLASLSRSLAGKQAFVEVSGLALGDQVEARWVPLLAVTYDRKDDIIVLDLGDLNHVIQRPTEVDVAVEGGQVASIEVIDHEGIKHIVRLREPLALAQAS